VIIMSGPGRKLRARRDRDRNGSGRNRTRQTEPVVVVPVVSVVPVAVRGAEILWIVVPARIPQKWAPVLRKDARLYY
jgi:hypothetical protein